MSTSRIRAAAVALSACALLSFGASAPAFAEGGPVDPYNVALINTMATAELHVTKYAGTPVSTTAPDGTLQTVTGRTALAGVTFKVTMVSGVDLATNAGWAAAKTYYQSTGVPPLSATTFTGVTDTSGQVTFAALPLGLYYVQEVSAPAGYTMAAPFLVTLPMTSPTKDSWMYNVYVYPKNAQDTITKTVQDLGTQTALSATGPAAGHAVDYTVQSSITDGTSALGMHVVNDNLDASVDYTGISVTLTNGTTLTRCDTVTATTCDYQVYVGADGTMLTFQGTDATVSGGPTVSVVFTAAGLAKLEADRAAEVKTVIHSTLNNAATGDGIVSNTATLIPNESWWMQNKGTTTYDPAHPDTTAMTTTTPGIASTPVESQYGDVKVVKHDAVTPTTMLAGTEFTLYRDANDDDLCTSADAVAANVLAGPIATDASGVALFSGLQVSRFYNGSIPADPINPITYCLVETKAPAGYNLNAEAIAFEVTAAGSTDPKTITVADEPTNIGNSLPLTGGAGVAAVSGLGVIFVGGGLAYYLAGARRRREDEV